MRHCCAVLLTAAAVLLRKELLLADCEGPVAIPESPEPPLADEDEPLTVAELEAEVESAPGDGDLGAVSLLLGAALKPSVVEAAGGGTGAATTTTPDADGSEGRDGVGAAGAGEARALDDKSCTATPACAPMLEVCVVCDASEPLRKRWCSCCCWCADGVGVGGPDGSQVSGDGKVTRGDGDGDGDGASAPGEARSWFVLIA